MRRLTAFLLLAMAIVMPLPAYTVETSKGPMELVVPEGMTLEEAFCEMGRLYLEERFGYEELSAQVDSLITSVENYKTAVDELNRANVELLSKNEELISLYEKGSQKRVLAPLVKLGVGWDILAGSWRFGIGFGAEFMERCSACFDFTYPWSVSLSIGVKF